MGKTWLMNLTNDPSGAVQEEEELLAKEAEDLVLASQRSQELAIRIARELESDKAASLLVKPTKEPLEAMTLEESFTYILGVIGTDIRVTGEVQKIEDEVKFQGFDPTVSAIDIMNCEIALIGSKKHDVLYMIVLGHQRGKNLAGILSKSSDAAIIHIGKLIKSFVRNG